MKKIYCNYLKAILKQRIPVELDGFEPFTVRIPSTDKGKSHIRTNEQIYVKKVDDKFFLFLCITPDTKHDDFWLKIGWSNKGRFPWNIDFFLADIDKSNSEFLKDEYVFNYNCLYVQKKDKNWPGHSTWKVWQCSVPVSDPTFSEKYIVESLAPVSEEIATQRVNDAVNVLIDDVRRIVLPYFEERITQYLKTGQ